MVSAYNVVKRIANQMDSARHFVFRIRAKVLFVVARLVASNVLSFQTMLQKQLVILDVLHRSTLVAVMSMNRY